MIPIDVLIAVSIVFLIVFLAVGITLCVYFKIKKKQSDLNNRFYMSTEDYRTYKKQQNEFRT